MIRISRTFCLVLSLVCGSGCLQSRTVPCGDLICPIGTVCAPGAERCVLGEQLSACDGLLEGEACRFSTETGGTCTGGVCFVFRCGDGFRDGAEVCDDGNTADGDGCSDSCDSDETCGNNIYDPQAGEQCDDGNTEDGDECQSTCQVPRCGDGIIDPEEACDDGNVTNGDGCNRECTSDETCGNGVLDLPQEQCDDGPDGSEFCGPTCVPRFCGNGEMDPGEVCDDGNLDGGDGCGPACNSREVCGNGVADFGSGEQCDDGNFRSHDGCSSRCSVELPVMNEIESSATYQRHPRTVYDASEDRLISFGGLGPVGEGIPGTRVFEGGLWSVLNTDATPGARQGHALVYDAHARRTLLFGGETAVAMSAARPLGDTWVLEGRQWRQLDVRGPPALSGIAGAYDVARETSVFFGGVNAGGELSSVTWGFDAGRWRELATTGPSARRDPVIAYDAVRGRIVLYGGVGAGDVVLRDTWEWDGSSWTERVGASSPANTNMMVFDGRLGQVVLFGGRVDELSSALYAFDGSDWMLVDAGDGVPPRYGADLEYMPSVGLVLHGGGDAPAGFGPSDDWIFDAGGWTEQDEEDEPEARLFPMGGFDESRASFTLIGGQGMSMPGSPPGPGFTDAWAFSRRSWSRLEVSGAPDSSMAVMAYDSRRSRFVGVRNRGMNTETWLLNGDRWVRLDVMGPPRISGAEMVYDRARDRMVLFGGQSRMGLLNRTWEFDGEGWVRATPTTSPSGRTTPLMAYDAANERVLLYGGQNADRLNQSDTWAYDGTTWTALEPETSPPPSSGRGMVFDPVRQTVTLIGGFPSRRAVWEFVDGDWQSLSVALVPAGRRGPLLAYDTNRDEILFANGSPVDDIWSMRFVSDVPDEICGNDVDDDDDGVMDCMDPDCTGKSCAPNMRCIEGVCDCASSTESLCSDGLDEDCDGLRDCDDPDCATDAYCGAEASCSDGLDDDVDGLADCLDPGCAGMSGCEAFERSCGDMNDNDGDGRVDCDDPDCYLVVCASAS